jgi:hypothetical protein
VASLNSADGVSSRAPKERLVAACLFLVIQSLALQAVAEAPWPEPASDPGHPRSGVVVGISGPLDEQVRSELLGLLEAELRAAGLELVERDPGGALSAWVAEVSGSRTLLAVLLDVRDRPAWRLVVIDAARSRAIARELAGGVEHNAASIEAVVSIVLSAASALREGLEVASSSVDQVVGTPEPPSHEPAPPRAAERVATDPERVNGLGLRARVGAALASLSSEALVTWGPSASVGLRLGQIELQVGADYYLPVTLQSAFGRFQIERAIATLSGGPRLLEGAFTLVPQAGVCLEWLARLETSPAPGVSARAGRTFQRWGGLLSLRGRYELAPPVSLELVLGASYFGRAVQFVARDPSTVRLVDVPPVVFHGQFGLEVALD